MASVSPPLKLVSCYILLFFVLLFVFSCTKIKCYACFLFFFVFVFIFISSLHGQSAT